MCILLLLLLLVGAAVWIAGARVPRLRRALQRMRADPEQFAELIAEQARRQGVSPALIKAVIWKESRFVPGTVGGKGEVGLMQLTEGAVRDWADAHGCSVPMRTLWFDPHLNVEVGAWYLARAMNRWRQYESMEILALSEYNAGQSRALRWAPSDPGEELPMEGVRIDSTRAYITQIIARTRHYEQNEARE